MDNFIAVWNYQLLVSEGQPITLGKLISAGILLILGFYFAKAASSIVLRKAIRRMSIDSSMRYTLEKVSFYVVYVLTALFILQILSIPITVFAFVGGALAIGIGFGSQNVVNNFISGLIITFTQPLRVEDWVEVEGVFGQVTTIGSRSTILTTADNKQVIIPNSFFLEKAFTNWTLADRIVIGSVKVGVSYSSDPKKVESILLDVAKNNTGVLKNPPPTVQFQNFGDSSLDFELFFHVEFGPGRSARIVSSELRYAILAELNKNGVEIPYPHRQVLLKQV